MHPMTSADVFKLLESEGLPQSLQASVAQLFEAIQQGVEWILSYKGGTINGELNAELTLGIFTSDDKFFADTTTVEFAAAEGGI